jgi:hypothetical protein
MAEMTQRPEISGRPRAAAAIGIAERPLSVAERLYDRAWLRKSVLLVLIALAWEAYARWLNHPLLVPTFLDTVRAMLAATLSGELPARVLTSLRILLMGYGAGVALAAVLTVFAIRTRIGTDFLETMTAMFNPLPAIALLPLALIWFGVGSGSLVFVLVHSVLWAVALNTHSGFPGGVAHASDGWPQLRPKWHRIRRYDPDPGGIPKHPGWIEDRLGVRLADPHRGRTGVRRPVRRRGAGLVHFRGQEPVGDRQCLRGPADHHPDRPSGRECHLSRGGGPHRTTLGHAWLSRPPLPGAARVAACQALSGWHPPACRGASRLPARRESRSRFTAAPQRNESVIKRGQCCVTKCTRNGP